MIDDEKYVREADIKTSEPAVKVDGMDYVIIRTNSAGVHAGYLQSDDGNRVELVNARRLYYWSGAATLSELAMKGVSKPDNCKFPCEVDSIKLRDIEIIKCTEEARLSIKDIKEWTAH